MKQHLHHLRKILAVSLCAVMLCSTAVMIPDGSAAAGITAQAAQSYGDYEYEITSNGSARITQYWGTDTALIIPETINGKTVEEIGENAFAGSSVRMVYLPRTLKSIAKNAFLNCYYLMYIYVPKGVTKISEHALGYTDSGLNFIFLTIVGYAGTTAETYANENDLTFKTIPELVNKTSLSREKIYKTSRFSVNGSASGGVSPYVYAFSYKKTTDTKWTDIGTPFAEDVKTVTTSLPSVGKYEVKTIVRDTIGEETTKINEIEVVEDMENVSTLSSERTDPGTAITAYGIPENGIGPFQYTFKYKKHSGTNWTICGETEQSESEQDIVINEEGVYDIRVTIKDSFSNSVHKNFLVYVSDSKVPVSNAKSSVSKTRIDPGEEITLKAFVEKGFAPYTNAFYYKEASADQWTDIGGGFTDKTSVTFSSIKDEGQYIVRIVSKDVSGNTAEKQMKVNVSDSSKPLSNISEFSTSRIDPSETFTLSAKATGGTAPYKYSFYYKKSTDENWTLSGKEFQTEAERDIAFRSEGKYLLKTVVKDAAGETSEKEFELYVSDSSKQVSNLSAISAAHADPNEAVTVTAAAKYGYAPYTYSYYCRSGDTGEWTLSGEEDTSALTNEMTFAEEGKYGVLVKVKDSAGTVISKSFTVYVSDSKSELVNNAAVSAERVDPNEALTVTASAEHGFAPYTYSFYYSKNNTGTWTLSGKEKQSDNTREMKFLSEGDYGILVKVHDANGNVAEKKFVVYVSDSKTALVNNAAISAKRVDPDEAVAVTAKARYGYAPYTYSFYYRKDNKGSWIANGEEDTSDGSSEMKFAEEGSYAILVKAKDSNGTIAYRSFTVNVSDSKTPIVNNSEVSAVRVDPNSPIMVTANAEHGFAPYRYTFYYRKNNTGDWTRSGKDNQPENTREMKFVSEGSYGILVKIKDASGATASKSFVVYVSDSSQALINNSAISAKHADPDEAVTVTSQARHGFAPYTYSYYYRKDGSGSWISAADEDTELTSCGMTFTDEGKYNILVKAKDANETTVSKTYTLYVSDSKLPLANNSEVSTVRAEPNETFRITANAANGTAPYRYTFYYRKNNTGEWTRSGKDNQAENTRDLAFVSEGTYGLLVKIKDANGTTASKNFVIYVSDSSQALINNSAISAKHADPDESVTVTSQARHGYAPYTYSYYFRKDGAGSWTAAGDEDTSSTSCDLAFTSEGKYNILVKAKDANETTVSKTYTLYVSDSKAALENNSTVSAERADPGKAITLTANAAHGTAPYRYTFYYRRNNTGDWTRSGKDNQAENTRNITFVSEGMYGLLVKIKDASGTTASKVFTVYVSDSSASLLNNSAISASRVDPEETVKVTAQAKHGYAPYSYSFYYRKNNTGSWTVSGEENTSESINEMTFSEEGKYGVLVKVRDAKGTVISKSFIVYVSDSTAPITNISEISTEEASTGEAITVTGMAAGGTAPYTYHFEYKKSSASEWKTFGKAFQSSETGTITFASRGSFDIRATIKDANGNTAEKTFNVTIG